MTLAAVSTSRKWATEFVGTALLVATVVGSGIMASRLSDDVGLQLLAGSIATGAVLAALIVALQPISASFNPVVTLVEAALRQVRPIEGLGLIVAQMVGGASGTVLANLMFELPTISISAHQRSGGGLWLAEVVATFGLVVIIFGAARSGRTEAIAFAVGGYIAAAYWFASSTSFANPALTVARMFSDTFAGIAPESALPFVVAQIVGGCLGFRFVRFAFPSADPVLSSESVSRGAS